MTVLEKKEHHSDEVRKDLKRKEKESFHELHSGPMLLE